jgi:hypothetical protein
MGVEEQLAAREKSSPRHREIIDSATEPVGIHH